MATKSTSKSKAKTTKEFIVPAGFPKPLQDRVIVTATPPETQTAGGIIIPDGAAEQQNKGYIMAVGPKVGVNGGVPLKPGDLVAYAQYGGTEIEHEGVQYFIMREAEILYKF